MQETNPPYMFPSIILLLDCFSEGRFFVQVAKDVKSVFNHTFIIFGLLSKIG